METGNQAGTAGEPAVVRSGDAAAKPAVADVVIPAVDDLVNPVRSELNVRPEFFYTKPYAYNSVAICHDQIFTPLLFRVPQFTVKF